MSTFYVLPSRPQLGERFAGYLGDLFPGLNWTPNAWAELAETLGDLAVRQPNVFVVFREELPAGEETAAALADGFGAAAGDEVIEILPEKDLSARRWLIGAAADAK